ncbi:MAG: hypothetical protein ABEJ30_05675 [Halorientalis sp.]
MESVAADSLREYIPDAPTADRSLAVLNRTRPDPVQRGIEKLFGDQPVDVADLSVPAGTTDLVVLLDDGGLSRPRPSARSRRTSSSSTPTSTSPGRCRCRRSTRRRSSGN